MSESKGPNWVVLGGAMLLAVPLFVVLVASFGRDPRAVPDALVDQPAPAFELVDLDGETHRLADHLGKRPVVLNFWSTWCGPCKIEHPLLLQAPDAYPDVAFYGVIYSDDVDKAARYLESAGSAFPHLVDPGSAVAIDLGVAGVPETYFIAEDGTIAYKHKGVLTRDTFVQQLGPPRGR